MGPLGVMMMAKRGRPKSVGESGSIRVPKDLYVMVQWIADAMKVSTTRVADRFLRCVVAELYLKVLPEVRRRYRTELRSAQLEGREPMPLPDLRVFLTSSYFDEKGKRQEFDLEGIHPKGSRSFYVSELPDDALEKVAHLGLLIPEELRVGVGKPEDLLDETPGSGFDVQFPLDRPGYVPQQPIEGDTPGGKEKGSPPKKKGKKKPGFNN